MSNKKHESGIAGLHRQLQRVLLLVVASVPLPALSQAVESGSFVVFNSSKNEIAVAADSRVYGLRRYSDDSCKIRAFGPNLIFAAAGQVAFFDLMGDPRLKWDVFTIAHDLFLRLSKENASEPMPVRLANAWGEEVKNKIKLDLSFTPELVRDVAPGAVVVSAIFTGFEGKEPLMVSGYVTYSRDKRGSLDTTFIVAQKVRQPALAMIGETAIGEEFGEQQTLRAKQWMGSIPFSADPVATKAISVVQFAEKYSPIVQRGGIKYADIAGPIDAVRIIRPMGIEWVQRKQNCPKD